MHTPPSGVGIMSDVVTPRLQAFEFLLRKKRQETGLEPRAPAENSFRGEVPGRTHSPSLGEKLTCAERHCDTVELGARIGSLP